MAKSLIKTVDGIGIWVRDGVSTSAIVWEDLILASLFISIDIVILYTYLYSHLKIPFVYQLPVLIGGVVCSLMAVHYLLIRRNVDCYEVYPAGSDDGIIIEKTTNEKLDQIAIYKAAKEIEAKCHEIAKKRRKLDNIAASCK